MGCCYSYEQEDDYVVPEPPHPVHAIRRPTPNATRSQSYYDSYYNQQHRDHRPRPGALYGEYKCRCGYFWVSRLSWRDKYQQCRRCKASVRPKNQRELRPSDFTRDENEEGLRHPQELCEMCKQVGGYCGNYK